MAIYIYIYIYYGDYIGLCSFTPFQAEEVNDVLHQIWKVGV